MRNRSFNQKALFVPAIAAATRMMMSILLILTSSGPALSADIPSQRFSVTVLGQGSDIIMIPGLASSAEVWRSEAELLKNRHRIHLIQVFGFAGTPALGNTTGPILAPLAEDLAAYIQNNRLEKPIIIGHSLGGLLAMMIETNRPGALHGLVVVDSLPFIGLMMGPAASVESVAPAATAMRDQILSQGQEAYAKAEIAVMARLMKAKGPAADAALLAAQNSDHKVVARAMFEAFNTDLRAKLATMNVPSMILYPYDPALGIPLAAVDSIYRSAFNALPRKELVRIDNSYHFIQVDRPEAFHQNVTKFLLERK